MQIQHSVPLSTLTTMRLGGPAQAVVTVTTKEELSTAIAEAQKASVPFFVIGGGSNIIARDEGFAGLIVLNRIYGFEVLSKDDTHTTIRVNAGENWDETVGHAVELGLSGIEAMSAIPGTVGATPVQNVGAYGQEIADTLTELEVLDTETGEFVTLKNDDCGFSYRSSIFKDPAERHYVIVSVTLRLNHTPMQPPFYKSLQSYLDEHGITDCSPASIRKAVTEIRATKLPDPSIIANTGSFFKNPIVSAETAASLAEAHPDAPQFPMQDGRVKLAAGWLIEQTGLKGYVGHGMKTYEHNALVLVNEAASSYNDLLSFRDEIVDKVREKFNVTLEQEPETL